MVVLSGSALSEKPRDRSSFVLQDDLVAITPFEGFQGSEHFPSIEERLLRSLGSTIDPSSFANNPNANPFPDDDGFGSRFLNLHEPHVNHNLFHGIDTHSILSTTHPPNTGITNLQFQMPGSPTAYAELNRYPLIMPVSNTSQMPSHTIWQWHDCPSGLWYWRILPTLAQVQDADRMGEKQPCYSSTPLTCTGQCLNTYTTTERGEGYHCAVYGCQFVSPDANLILQHISQHLKKQDPNLQRSATTPETPTASGSQTPLSPISQARRSSLSTILKRGKTDSFLCDVPNCSRGVKGKGFSRRDNLLNHQRSVHGIQIEKQKGGRKIQKYIIA